MLRRVPSLLILLLLAGAALPNAVQLSFFKAEKVGSDLVISWQARVEDSVREYVLERRTPHSNGEFVEIKQRFAAHGTGKPYRFQDDQLYKSPENQVDYRLYAVYVNNDRVRLAEQKVNYTATAIRRTWGSIKAMFQ